MKINFKIHQHIMGRGIVFLLVMLGAHVSCAEPVVLESFDYSVGENLNNQSGGTGFPDSWVSDSDGITPAEFMIGSNLSFGKLDSAGNSVGRADNNGRSQAHRLISTDARSVLLNDNATIWFSVLWRPGASASDERGAFLFGNTAFGTADGDPKTAGDGFGFSPFDGVRQSSIRANAWVSGDASDDPNTSVDTGIIHEGVTTYLVVGKINWKPVGTPDEYFLFNISDPTASEPEETSAIASITSVDFDQSGWDTIALYENNAGSFDEIRFGSTYADVVPIAPNEFAEDSIWTEWYRPADQPVFTTAYGNNHDAVIFHEPELEYPYHMIVSHTNTHAYLWRAQSFSWNSDDWELVTDGNGDEEYIIDNHYEFDDGVKVDGTYYIFEEFKVYTYSGDLSDSSGQWTLAGSFPSGCDDLGVFYEDGVFHIFGEFGVFPYGFDGTSLSHYTSTNGLGDWVLIDSKAVDPNPDGGDSKGVGDPTIIKIDGVYYLFCDIETEANPYRITAWATTDIYEPFQYLGIAFEARSGETNDWDNYRVQDADIVYVPELKRFIMVCNMMDTDGVPGPGTTRVIGTFYSSSLSDLSRNSEKIKKKAKQLGAQCENQYLHFILKNLCDSQSLYFLSPTDC